MRVSTRYPVAVHCMLWLAAFPDYKGTSEVLANSTGCNAVIIRGIFSELNKAGLLVTKSGRGKTVLAKPAQEITLWDIYTAVESSETDELFKFHQHPSQECPVGSNLHDVLEPHLSDAVVALKKELSAVTLQDLVDELSERTKQTPTQKGSKQMA